MRVRGEVDDTGGIQEHDGQWALLALSKELLSYSTSGSKKPVHEQR